MIENTDDPDKTDKYGFYRAKSNLERFFVGYINF
jgi:hypothetical protein